MKKICFISFQAFPLLANLDVGTHGGAELQFKILAQNFVKKGVDVHFVVDDCGQDDFKVIGGINIHKVPLRYMGGSNKYLLSDWFHFVRSLSRIDADYYLIKTPRHLLFPLGLWGKIFHKKVIFVGQIDDDADNVALRKKDGFFSYWLYVVGMRWTDYVVAQNFFQFCGFVKQFGKSSCVIRNVLSLPVKNTIAKGDRILWVGNNLSKKHPEVFLELAEKMPQYRFTMIMSTTSQYPSDTDVIRRASEIPNLEYLGFVPFNRIYQYFEKAKLFVGTSDREGFPNTYLQAWQYKTPVVSLHLDPDNIIDKYGLGSCSKTFENLRMDINRFMENPDLLNLAAQRCAKYVIENHSVENIVRNYMNVFDSLMH